MQLSNPHAAQDREFAQKRDILWCLVLSLRGQNSTIASCLMQEQLVGVVLDYMTQHEAEYCTENHGPFVLMVRFCAGGLTNLYLNWFAGKVPYTITDLTACSEKLLTSIIMYAR